MSDNLQATEAEAQEAPAEGLMAETAVEETPEQIQDIPHKAEDVIEDDEDIEYERPDFFPEKFWDSDGPDIEKLVASYKELETKFSQGKHKAPDQYDLSALGDNVSPDDDPVVEAYLDWAGKFGINQEAFDALASTITSMAGESQQQEEIDIANEKKALGSNADAIIKSNTQWADGLVRKGILSTEERAEIAVWGGTAVGQRMLQKMRSMQGDMTTIPLVSVSEAQMSDEEFKADMASKMADPRYGSDPKYTRDIEQAFMNRYQ